MLPVLREGREFDDLKSVLQNLDFRANFSCKIVSLTDIPNGEFEFPHGLKSVPSGRIIIKQVGGGFITDSATPPDSKKITLINSGSSISELKLIVLG